MAAAVTAAALHNINYWLVTSGPDAPRVAEDSDFGPAVQAAIRSSRAS
ncbi:MULTISPECIES: hypothetical protein [Streptomyces]|nr:hypothetical protein [Streptomyces triticiradicis]